MEFDEALGGYVYEADGVRCIWDEEPEGDRAAEAGKIADRYRAALPHIIDFVLSELSVYFGEICAEDAAKKLGRPLIDPAKGTVTYCEQTFDDIHIFSFEYFDEMFEELDYFSMDG